MKPLPAFLASTILVGLMATACAAAPQLDGTVLYTRTTHDCQAVDLRTWRHPTLIVLKERGVSVRKVELCNDKRYPVFTVSFPFDPRGQTDAYFPPLYVAMAVKNGSWPFSFVDVADAVIVDIVPKGESDIKVEYEDYEQAATAK